MVHKSAAGCYDLWKEIGEVRIVNINLERRLLKEEEGLDGHFSELSQRYLFKLLQSKGQLARGSDGIMVCADYCYYKTSCETHATRLYYIKYICSSMRQPVMTSVESYAVWIYGNADCPKSFVRYSHVY